MASLLDNVLSFGATPPEYLGGLVGQQGVEDLRKRAGTTGVFNALVGYLATPKNQGLGIGTILGNTLMAGQQGAQGVYDQATQDYMMQQKLDEMNRAKEMQARKDAFISSIGQPNATRQIVTPSGTQEPVPAEAGAVAPSFATQPTAPTVTQESYYDPNVMLQQALATGAIDLKDYLAATAKKKQGTQLLSNKEIEQLKTEGFELPTDRGQKYQRDIDTGKIDLVQGTLAPEKPTFKVGDIQEFESNGKKITREFQGNNNWKIIGTSAVNSGTGQEGVDYLSPVAQQKAAAIYNQGGGLPPLGNSKAAALIKQNIMNIAALMDGGKSPADAARSVLNNKQNLAAQQQTLKSFAGGIDGRTKRSMNTATDHLFTLEEAGNALKNGNIRLFNSIGNKINKEIGVPAPVTFEGVKKIVAGELVKATTGSAGALGDREEIQASIDAANSPEQLLDQISYYKKLMAGQLQGLEYQWVTGTNRSSAEFRTGLTPRTRNLLPPAIDTNDASPAPSTQVAPQPIVSTKLPATSDKPSEKGWVLQVDPTTNVKAYVNPKNTKQYRIVAE
jgi:hypothetical protein